MILIRKPTDAAIRNAFEDAGPAFTSDPRVSDPPPPGYWSNAGSQIVGHGEYCFDGVSSGIRHWNFGPGPWFRFIHDGPAVPDQPVAVLARCLGLYAFNICRVIDRYGSNTAAGRSLSIVYATTAGHNMRGAEEFRVDWDRQTDAVSVTIQSYSRPASFIGWLALPYIRSVQRRFVRQTLENLQSHNIPADALPTRVKTPLSAAAS